MSNDALIALRDVSYTYPNSLDAALRHVDLTINAGEFVLLTGPSGSGKSTLLRAFNGLVPHFSGGVIGGEIRVCNLDVVEAGPERLCRYVGFVSQNPEAQSLLERVEPEIAFALENTAVPQDEMKRRVQYVLEMLNLTHLRRRALATLSGGERQRVAIACALVLRPQILVLDEPTSQLDPQSAEEVLSSLLTLNRDYGLTIVLAEHRLERVLPFAQRMVTMERGSVVAQGEVREVLPFLDPQPPLIELGLRAGWSPLPLDIEEARVYAVDPLPMKPPPTLHGPFEASETVLEVRDLSFSYPKSKPAIDHVNLRLRAGEILAILGPNGSGKSTLLRCLIGLMQPGSGDIMLNGRSTKRRNTADLAQQMAYLPQYPDDLLFAESVRRELEITLENNDRKPGSQVDRLLRELDLEGTAERYPRDLSTGQRQRVALGAVLVTEPRVLLLDEPTRGLDGRLKGQLAALWRRWAAAGMAILLVTHDVELVAQLADTMLLLDHGEVIAYGDSKEVVAAHNDFAPQIARLFPGHGLLTTKEALSAIGAAAVH